GLALRPIRDLRTNLLGDGRAALARGVVCRDAFSDARWRSFVSDVSAFRSSMDRAAWEHVFVDHGFNATPPWILVGRAVTAGAPPPGRLRALAWLDRALLAVAAAALAWAFGWRVLALATVFLLAFHPAELGWTAGGLLRQDWLASVIVGGALVRRDRP